MIYFKSVTQSVSLLVFPEMDHKIRMSKQVGASKFQKETKKTTWHKIAICLEVLSTSLETPGVSKQPPSSWRFAERNACAAASACTTSGGCSSGKATLELERPIAWRHNGDGWKYMEDMYTCNGMFAHILFVFFSGIVVTFLSIILGWNNVRLDEATLSTPSVKKGPLGPEGHNKKQQQNHWKWEPKVPPPRDPNPPKK